MPIDPADLELPPTRPVDLTLLNEELLAQASVLTAAAARATTVDVPSRAEFGLLLSPREV
jgi:hypothetical protein